MFGTIREYFTGHGANIQPFIEEAPGGDIGPRKTKDLSWHQHRIPAIAKLYGFWWCPWGRAAPSMPLTFGEHSSLLILLKFILLLWIMTAHELCLPHRHYSFKFWLVETDERYVVGCLIARSGRSPHYVEVPMGASHRGWRPCEGTLTNYFRWSCRKKCRS